MSRPGIPLSEIEVLAAQVGDLKEALIAFGDERLLGLAKDADWIQKRLLTVVDPATGQQLDAAAELDELREKYKAALAQLEPD